MKTKKLITSFGLVLVAFVVAGFSLFPPPAEASQASLCNGFSRLGRAGCRGYFTGTNFYGSHGLQGQNILDCTKSPSTCTNGAGVNNAIPSSINTGPELVSWIQGYLFNTGGTSYNYNKAGAAFIVDAMLGKSGTSFGNTTAGIAYAQAHFSEWSAAVNAYANLGWIDWSISTTLPVGSINSMHACWPSVSNCTQANIGSHDSHDFTFFKNNVNEPSHVLRFRNPNGTTFDIRRECANLLGQLGPLTLPNFNLNPSVSTKVNGAAATAAEPGDTVQFTYTVNNSGTMPSSGTNCNTYANVHSGYFAARGSSATAGGSAGPNPGCPRNFPAGGTTITTENVPISAGNQTVCRTLIVTPATYSGGTRGFEACIIVTNKPYLKVFGGDIAAGGGLSSAPSTCTNNNNAAVVAWNKRASSYSGAGAQYAVYALATITDFSSAQNLSGGAAEPAGLSFANTSTNIGAGNFGGSWGTATCIPDYYGRKPASTSPLPANVSAMSTGAYSANATTNLAGGSVNPGDKISVYIDGDLYISSDITYAGSWSAANMPLFELVVRGNIYIGSGVHRLDGVYIAQKNGAAGGTIYTCATSTTPLVLTNGAFFNTCNSKLVVNGAFVASSVQFLRTAASLGQSSTGETSSVTGAGTNAAEVFNYNPTLWMVQPNESDGTVDNYDAITSLPPVL